MATQATVSQNSLVLKPDDKEFIREEQVLNAVKFLSHPIVRGSSSVALKRYFLENKGLTEEEIDEAFLFLPPAVVTNQDTKLISTLVPALSRFYWTQVLVALGLVATSGAGILVFFKNVIATRLKPWIRKLVLEEGELNEKSKLERSSSEETTDAAADVAQASQEVLVSETEESRRIGELMNLLKIQAKEMESMRTTLRNLEGRAGHFSSQYNSIYASGSRPSNANVYPTFNYQSGSCTVVASQPPSATVKPLVPPHLKYYTQVRSSTIAGRQPLNINPQELGQSSEINTAEYSGREVQPDLDTILSVPHKLLFPGVNLSGDLEISDELRTIEKEGEESQPRDNKTAQSGDGDVDDSKTESSDVKDGSARR